MALFCSGLEIDQEAALVVVVVDDILIPEKRGSSERCEVLIRRARACIRQGQKL